MAKKPTVRQRIGWNRLSNQMARLEPGQVEAGVFRRRAATVQHGENSIRVTAQHVELLSRTVTQTTILATYCDTIAAPIHISAYEDTYQGGREDSYVRQEFVATAGEVTTETLPVRSLMKVLRTAQRAAPTQQVSFDVLPAAPQAGISAQYLQGE